MCYQVGRMVNQGSLGLRSEMPWVTIERAKVYVLCKVCGVGYMHGSRGWPHRSTVTDYVALDKIKSTKCSFNLETSYDMSCSDVGGC